MKKILLLTLLLLTFPAHASALELNERDHNDVLRAQYYLSQINTMKTNFMQISPYFTTTSPTAVSYGTLYLNRPGAARWEYETPNKMLIIIKDDQLSYYDYDLDQVSYKDIEDEVMLSLLTKADIKFFGADLLVTEFARDEYGFNILLERTDHQERKPEEREQLLMTFLEHPLRLKRMKFRDVNGYITTIELEDIKANIELDKDLFTFKSPRIFQPKSRKN